MEHSLPDNTNWNQQRKVFFKKSLPDSTASFILGLVGLVLSICLGCGIVGFILSIIAMIKGHRMINLYEANPEVYSTESFENAKIGKTLGIIGFILGIVVILIMLAIFAAVMLGYFIRES